LDKITNDEFKYIGKNEEKAMFELLKNFKIFDLVSDLEKEVRQFLFFYNYYFYFFQHATLLFFCLFILLFVSLFCWCARAFKLTQAKDRIERLEGLVQSLSNKCNFFENHFDYLKSVTNETTHCEHEQIIQTQLSNSTHVHIHGPAETPQQHQVWNQFSYLWIVFLIKFCSKVVFFRFLNQGGDCQKRRESHNRIESRKRYQVLCPFSFCLLLLFILLLLFFIKELQKIFNKRVVYEVKRNFGKNYLADHQVRDLDSVKMLHIRGKYIFRWQQYARLLIWFDLMMFLRNYFENVLHIAHKSSVEQCDEWSTPVQTSVEEKATVQW